MNSRKHQRCIRLMWNTHKTLSQKSLRDVARVHLADLGTRVFYTQHGGYDNHANEVPTHPRLLTELTEAIQAFFTDLRAHDASEEVIMYVFTEFGRRIRDNASGTDHGTGGGAFIIGDRVKGWTLLRISVSRPVPLGYTARTLSTPSTSGVFTERSLSSGWV